MPAPFASPPFDGPSTQLVQSGMVSTTQIVEGTGSSNIEHVVSTQPVIPADEASSSVPLIHENISRTHQSMLSPIRSPAFHIPGGSRSKIKKASPADLLGEGADVFDEYESTQTKSEQGSSKLILPSPDLLDDRGSGANRATSLHSSEPQTQPLQPQHDIGSWPDEGFVQNNLTETGLDLEPTLLIEADLDGFLSSRSAKSGRSVHATPDPAIANERGALLHGDPGDGRTNGPNPNEEAQPDADIGVDRVQKNNAPVQADDGIDSIAHRAEEIPGQVDPHALSDTPGGVWMGSETESTTVPMNMALHLAAERTSNNRITNQVADSCVAAQSNCHHAQDALASFADIHDTGDGQDSAAKSRNKSVQRNSPSSSPNPNHSSVSERQNSSTSDGATLSAHQSSTPDVINESKISDDKTDNEVHRVSQSSFQYSVPPVNAEAESFRGNSQRGQAKKRLAKSAISGRRKVPGRWDEISDSVILSEPSVVLEHRAAARAVSWRTSSSTTTNTRSSRSSRSNSKTSEVFGKSTAVEDEEQRVSELWASHSISQAPDTATLKIDDIAEMGSYSEAKEAAENIENVTEEEQASVHITRNGASDSSEGPQHETLSQYTPALTVSSTLRSVSTAQSEGDANATLTLGKTRKRKARDISTAARQSKRIRDRSNQESASQRTLPRGNSGLLTDEEQNQQAIMNPLSSQSVQQSQDSWTSSVRAQRSWTYGTDDAKAIHTDIAPSVMFTGIDDESRRATKYDAQ
ncbi:uncharacterized protein BJ171DRAFT_26064 [Polychytrium aggregatum]|uniref:uncharacterized protein n=1 Tax=Polychytrium aggregatum TaxID=110093 RepID=UPI0022FE7EEA|nr:uncharacterized protein BJ171DRAFT_26064 [Polychytrium aggregatum]KAI9192949.1 hypothetical protein BJ171DRAFT_26064 [Polychytrium aggregatum]